LANLGYLDLEDNDLSCLPAAVLGLSANITTSGNPGYSADTGSVPACESQPNPTPTPTPTDTGSPTPTPTPTDTGGPSGSPVSPGEPAESDLVDAAKGGITTPPTAYAGDPITVRVGTGHAGQLVDAFAFSDPVWLGSRTVAADGTIKVTLPAGIASGPHRIAVYGSAGQLIGWDETVVLARASASASATATGGAGRLEYTGSHCAGLAAAALALVLAGAAMAAGRRRLLANR
jgi:hypothetical protein